MDNKEYDRKIRNVTSSIILKSVIFFIFIIFFIIYVDFNTTNENKSNLKLKVDEYKKVSKEGLNFEEYLNSINDPKTKSLIVSIGKKYFNENLSNKTNANYNDFLKEKKSYVNELKNSESIRLRGEKISKVLPSYTKGAYIEGNLNDLGFVNYLEVLLRTFGLKTTSSLGVGDLVVYDGGKTDNKKSFGSSIFYMPITLSLEGKKSDIVDFIYFVQNVGNIQDIKSNDFSIYKDKMINKVIIGQDSTLNYNIYENNFMDISEISFSDYIDSSSNRRNETQKSTNSFFSFLKNSEQKDEIFNINISLRFYVKGVPENKVTSFLNELNKKHQDLTKKIKSIIDSQKSNKSGDYLLSLKSLELYLNDLSSKKNGLPGKASDKSKLEEVYKEASDIMYELNNISSKLDNLSNK